jgi:hypothetical protein
MSGDVCEPRHENRSTEHRIAVCHIFCVNLGDRATTIHEKLQQVFGDDAMSRAPTFHWHRKISESRTLFEDEQGTTQHR